jgi:sugar-specific transcriptional regulator TrmB
MYDELFEKLGLRQSERAVYLALLKGGALNMTEIADAAGLYRPAAYSALDRLRELGLIVAAPKGKRMRYSAESPQKLKTLVTHTLQELDTALPALLALQRFSGVRPVMKYLEGKIGMKSIFADVVESLKTGEVFYRYTSEKDIDRANSYLPKNYRAMRDAKKLERFVISNAASGTRKAPRMERAIKIVSPNEDLFDSDVIEIIYGTKVAFLDLSTETGIILESAPLADFQKRIFKLLYKKL